MYIGPLIIIMYFSPAPDIGTRNMQNKILLTIGQAGGPSIAYAVFVDRPTLI